jgi:hypothetical protein
MKPFFWRYLIFTQELSVDEVICFDAIEGGLVALATTGCVLPYSKSASVGVCVA